MKATISRLLNMSITKRIYLSFFLLVSLFGFYSIVTIITLNDNRVLSKHISEVLDPMLQENSDFRKLLLESKMYTTNWVFLGAKQEDKDALVDLHKNRYSQLKIRTHLLINKMADPALTDSVNKEFASFDQLVVYEKEIMKTLIVFDDYQDPFKRLNSEHIIETEILPRTDALILMHDHINAITQNIRGEAQAKLDASTMRLRILILSMMIVLLIIGFALAKYLTNIITKPISKIVRIVNDAGKGILEKVKWKESRDEIGEMVRAVNNLSSKLSTTASFAEEIGKRNFDIRFQPLSDKDILGKSLIKMRDNLKSSDERLDEAQTIAKLGNWECDLELKFKWSKEMYSILDYEPFQIEPSYKAIINPLHENDKHKLQTLLAQCLNSGLPFTFHGNITTVKGNIKNVRIQAKLASTSKNGKEKKKIIGIMQDITEQLRRRFYRKQMLN